MSTAERCVRVLVGGRVQGVWFRESTRLAAERLGVCGWVRNLADGRVEACFEGSAVAVERAIEFAREGPPHARVEECRVEERPAEGCVGFEVRRTGAASK